MSFPRCSKREEVRDLLAQGHWPEACPAELRAHVASCRGCSETVMLTQGFRAAKEESAHAARLVPANLVWWRAQLRRRQTAMEQVSKPIWGAQIFAVVMSLCGVAGLAGWATERGEWRTLVASFEGMGGLLTSAKNGLGAGVVIVGVAALALLGAVTVFLTVERE